MRSILPLFFADLGRPFLTKVSCSDASEAGVGIVVATVKYPQVEEIFSVSEI